jgi:hypothetical protein
MEIKIHKFKTAKIVHLDNVRVNAAYKEQLKKQGYELHSIHKDIFGRYGFVRAI